MRDECMRGYALQAHLSAALVVDPDDAELSFVVVHLQIENLPGPNIPPHALDNQADYPHIYYQCGVRKPLALSITPSYL